MKQLFCIGLGYSALALARRLQTAGGWTVKGTATSRGGAEKLAAMGFTSYVFDGAAPSPDVGRVVRESTHLLISAPPNGDGDPVLRDHGEDIAAAPDLGWIGYLSTIGVYGDRQGAWIDETAIPHPAPGRSMRRLEAENAWLALGAKTGKRVQVFRLAGIYGPGRSAIDSLRAGVARAIVKPGQVFNRIHVEDIAATVEAAMAAGGAHSIYNVTDDEPAPPQDVTAYAAKLLGVAPPPEIPFERAALSDMARSFYSENKRVKNSLIKDDLGVALRFPTYREGLAMLAQSRE